MDSSIDLSQNDLKRVRVSIDKDNNNMDKYRINLADEFSSFMSKHAQRSSIDIPKQNNNSMRDYI